MTAIVERSRRLQRKQMHEIQTEIDIATTPERLWPILTDLSAYPSWNPFIRSINGYIEKGQRLTVSIQPLGGRAMTFRPTVLLATPNMELAINAALKSRAENGV